MSQGKIESLWVQVPRCSLVDFLDQLSFFDRICRKKVKFRHKICVFLMTAFTSSGTITIFEPYSVQIIEIFITSFNSLNFN